MFVDRFVCRKPQRSQEWGRIKVTNVQKLRDIHVDLIASKKKNGESLRWSKVRRVRGELCFSETNMPALLYAIHV